MCGTAGIIFGMGGGGGGATNGPKLVGIGGGGGGWTNTLKTGAETATGFGALVYLRMLDSNCKQTASVTLFTTQKDSTCLSKPFTPHRMVNSEEDPVEVDDFCALSTPSKSNMPLYFKSKACCSTFRCNTASRLAVTWFHLRTNCNSLSSSPPSASTPSISCFNEARNSSNSVADDGEFDAGGGGGRAAAGVVIGDKSAKASGTPMAGVVGAYRNDAPPGVEA